MEPLFIAKDLCKTFSNGSIQQHVLKNLNIEVNPKDFVVIMGSSGSGKSWSARDIRHFPNVRFSRSAVNVMPGASPRSGSCAAKRKQRNNFYGYVGI